MSDEGVKAEIAALSTNDARRLTKWARTKLTAAGYNNVRDDSDKLASTRREILHEMLAADQRFDGIEHGGSDADPED